MKEHNYRAVQIKLKQPLSIKLRGQIILQYCFGVYPDGRGVAAQYLLQLD